MSQVPAGNRPVYVCCKRNGRQPYAVLLDRDPYSVIWCEEVFELLARVCRTRPEAGTIVAVDVDPLHETEMSIFATLAQLSELRVIALSRFEEPEQLKFSRALDDGAEQALTLDELRDRREGPLFAAVPGELQIMRDSAEPIELEQEEPAGNYEPDEPFKEYAQPSAPEDDEPLLTDEELQALLGRP